MPIDFENCNQFQSGKLMQSINKDKFRFQDRRLQPIPYYTVCVCSTHTVCRLKIRFLIVLHKKIVLEDDYSIGRIIIGNSSRNILNRSRISITRRSQSINCAHILYITIHYIHRIIYIVLYTSYGVLCILEQVQSGLETHQ